MSAPPYQSFNGLQKIQIGLFIVLEQMYFLHLALVKTNVNTGGKDGFFSPVKSTFESFRENI